MSEKKEISAYTDGACHGNPGPGGFGVLLRYGEVSKELSGGFRLTTNNRMELRAAIAALEALTQPCRVTVYSDSRYLVDAMERGWARRWESNQWRLKGSRQVANADLWLRLLALCENHEVEFVWVKGHAGIPGNERCDALAQAACRQPELPPDEGYEAQRAPQPEEPKAPTDTGADPLPVAGPGRNSRRKITEEGQPCRKCGTPVERRIPKRKKHKPGKGSYFGFYLYCPDCETTYLVESARVTLPQQEDLFS